MHEYAIVIQSLFSSFSVVMVDREEAVPLATNLGEEEEEEDLKTMTAGKDGMMRGEMKLGKKQ